MGHSRVRHDFLDVGFVILSGFLGPSETSSARDCLAEMFPTADEFHDDSDRTRNERYRSEFGGITLFPFAAVELSLVAVHPRLIDLAETLLDSVGLFVYSIEAWAKYTGAADYDQSLHRDYLNHSLLVPAPQQPPAQVEMFLYLSDVTDDLGPPAYVPRAVTDRVPALPNWYPAIADQRDAEHPEWVSPQAHTELYDREVLASGSAGTVVAYRIDTFHRGTAVRAPRGARYTIHVNFRRADATWISRRAWTDRANTDEWLAFVTRASSRQLQLFGFPPPGHAYWTSTTLDDLQRRYPGIDTAVWRG